MGLLNVMSLILGLFAWIIPINNILKRERYGIKRKRLLTIISFGFCSISVYFQLIYNYYLVNIKDWSAIMDTIGAVIIVSGILIFATIILNFSAFRLDKN